MTREQEEANLVRGNETIKKLTGKNARGYRSPSWELSQNTVDLLLKHGFVYESSLMGDDYTPYRCRQGDVVEIEKPLVFGKPTRLIEMPIAWSLDDFPHFEFLRMETQLMPGLMNANHVIENWINDFVYMTEHFEWGVLTYTFHPYVIGRGHRMMALEKLLEGRRRRRRRFRHHGGGRARIRPAPPFPWLSPPRRRGTASRRRRLRDRLLRRRLHRPLADAGHAAAPARGDGEARSLVQLGAAARAPLPRRAPGPAWARQLAEARARAAVLARPSRR